MGNQCCKTDNEYTNIKNRVDKSIAKTKEHVLGVTEEEYRQHIQEMSELRNHLRIERSKHSPFSIEYHVLTRYEGKLVECLVKSNIACHNRYGKCFYYA